MAAKFRSLCIFPLAILLIGCVGKPQQISFYEVSLNKNIKERYRSGTNPVRNEFQYGQSEDKALDILVPIDPSGSRTILKSQNYYVSEGSTVEFNMETLIEFSAYETNMKDKKKGKLSTPRQWLSICTLKNPTTGNRMVDMDGNEFDPVIAHILDNRNIASFSLRKCNPLNYNCESYEMGGVNDPLTYNSTLTNGLYPFCMLKGRLNIETPSSFSRDVEIISYNDDRVEVETLHFYNRMSPTFYTVNDEVQKYEVQMRLIDRSSDDAVDRFLLQSNNNYHFYKWTMYEEDGILKDNFASDIDIEYVRFYWTDRYGNKYKIVNDPRFGAPFPVLFLQVGGNVCRIENDEEVYIRKDDCRLLLNTTPVANKGELNSKIAWYLKIFKDEYNYELMNYWSNPIIMEFGIKAN